MSWKLTLKPVPPIYTSGGTGFSLWVPKPARHRVFSSLQTFSLWHIHGPWDREGLRLSPASADPFRAVLDIKPPIERRADRIADPVERLRFLRQEMAHSCIARRPSRMARHAGWIGLLVALALVTGPAPKSVAETTVRQRTLLVPGADRVQPPSPISRVWRVDRSETSETYSNGLRVDLSFTVSNRPRANFPIYSLRGAARPERTGSAPVGIVYHMSESNLAPFEEDETRRLKRLGRNLLEVIRTERSYHYLIDRFGRVFSVVAESDAANHAGFSVWADAQGVYVNLNDSFIGVSFEGQTESSGEVTPAQINAAKLVTEMLRSRYSIAPENCVTHAQVSVNPLNMHIANHTDWAVGFPFSALGLPDNYAIALPSVYAFGFKHDDVFLQVSSGGWRGLDLANDQIERQAADENTSPVRYRAMLQHRYKEIAAALKSRNEGGSE